MKNEDQPKGRRMKIGTIIAATCAALAVSMAGPIYAHDSEAETVTKNFEAAHSQYPWQVAARRGGRLRAGRGLSVAHPRKIGFHLRLCDLGRDQSR